MCDTITVFSSAKQSFFAKNSDRDPAEFQFVYISNNPVEEFYEKPFLKNKDQYINNSFQTLKSIFDDYEYPYKAILSKPDWIWGAEMGVNEAGLAIGNEAVFSKEDVSEDGILGMDILRLALHNNKKAREAVDFIIDIIEKIPQGGNGSYTGKLYYHNSFLIKDFDEAYILETSSDKWVVKEVNDFATISNTYTIREDYQRSSENLSGESFKDEYQDKKISYFAKGHKRQRLSTSFIDNENNIDIQSIMELMRLHNKKSSVIKKGMTSICMHSGRLIRCETVSSMIVEYYKDKFVVWFTGSPNPCISLYKPLVFTGNSGYENIFYNQSSAYKYSKKWREYSRLMRCNYKYFREYIRSYRDLVEEKIIKEMDKLLKGETEFKREIWDESMLIAENYLDDVLLRIK